MLCSDEGMKIEKSMLNWLIPEYDVYCVYQKYPGILYEYPALRFAQWLAQLYNISFILYVHTKGAINKGPEQEWTRSIWKQEFTNSNKKKYIQLLKSNSCDIALPFRYGNSTWCNGMFISNRAFNLIEEIDYNTKNRYYYENLFGQINKINCSIRIKGVIFDNILSKLVYPKMEKILKKRKLIIIRKFVFVLSIELFIIYLKLINSKKKD